MSDDTKQLTIICITICILFGLFTSCTKQKEEQDTERQKINKECVQ